MNDNARNNNDIPNGYDIFVWYVDKPKTHRIANDIEKNKNNMDHPGGNINLLTLSKLFLHINRTVIICINFHKPVIKTQIDVLNINNEYDRFGKFGSFDE